MSLVTGHFCNGKERASERVNARTGLRGYASRRNRPIACRARKVSDRKAGAASGVGRRIRARALVSQNKESSAFMRRDLRASPRVPPRLRPRDIRAGVVGEANSPPSPYATTRFAHSGAEETRRGACAAWRPLLFSSADSPRNEISALNLWRGASERASPPLLRASYRAHWARRGLVRR